MTMNSFKEIGGYFGLEVDIDNKNLPIHSLALNTARNCIRYLIRTYNITKIHVPYYTCPVVFEAINQENCGIEFYHINECFVPEKTFSKNDFILYTNYFGICAKNVKNLAQKYSNLIVDNAQAYYMPKCGLASFNSARKFMGVPDGAFLQCDKLLNEFIELDKTSIYRFSHLLKRVDTSAQFGYEDYKNNEKTLENEGIKLMSNLTKALINSHNSKIEKDKRLKNFNYLHKKLKDNNKLTIDLNKDDVPMVYPYLVKNGKILKQKLIKNNIFVATYWNATNLNGIEQNFQDNLVALPIDQRYCLKDMELILKHIQRFNVE